MKPVDHHYLLLQFKNKIYFKSGIEFQSLFESIMEKAFSNFGRVPSGRGDGGNDGWIKEHGMYYQVYAPETNAERTDTEAAKKIKEDFQKLKDNWNNISEIKEYYFFYNDRYDGCQRGEKAIAELEEENPNIKFKILLAKDLEDLFFKLSPTDILDLGFSIDSRDAVSITNKFLQNVEIELDRECAKSALKILENSKDIVAELNDEGLSLKYEILECRCLIKLEKVDEAKEKYENISIRVPNDPRAFLYLAEICLTNNDFSKNRELLDRATKIDKNHWLLKLEELARKRHLGERINVANINEETFPNNSRIKANFYRLYALFLEDSGDNTRKDSFIEKAIHLNPDRFSNYIVKLSFIEGRLSLDQSKQKISQGFQKLLEETERVEKKFFEYGDIGARNKAVLNLKKLNALHVQENFLPFEKIHRETFKLALTCYFDKHIDQMLARLLVFLELLDDDFDELLKYLENSNKEISDGLSKALIFQFNIKDSIFVKGKKFFRETGNQKYLDFINDLENKNYENILKFLEDDIQFSMIIATSLNLPDLRRKIIKNLPDDKDIQKEKLLILINYEEKNFSDAFKILKEIDLTNLSYLECKPILKIVQARKAWDIEIIILEKLIEKETDEESIFYLKLQLFDAYFNLKKYPGVIEAGEKLLNQDSVENILDTKSKEALLARIILACLERGKVDDKFFKKSKEIIEKYKLTQPTFEFKAVIEARVYLENNEPHKALESVIEGAKTKKVFTQEEYARLYLLVAIEIENRINLKLDPLNKVVENTFVKLRNKERWYFIGDDNELDAIKISKENDKYPLFIGQTLGDKIIIADEYSSINREEIVESIFPIEKYILWQTVQNFHKLAKDQDLDGVQMVEVPQKEGTIDTKYLLNFLKDLRKRTEPLFDMYCKNNVPLAVLAVSEGGLTNAMGRIQQENKGFINFSTGTIEELEKQKGVAKNVIDKKIPFYIDGTSALLLSEIGLFKKFYTHLPNLRVPQSVINLLINITQRFRYTPGQTGYMGYAQGKITFSSVDKDRRDLIQSNFSASIKLLESKPKNISAISLANKVDCFSEQKVPGELSDACILAQKDDLPVLTEDFLYLKMNELETKKKSPRYFSSLILLRVLYEEGKVGFDEYLDFFEYLSLYRFRFLPLNYDDIEKAIFGGRTIKKINYENIRKLNFPLTLSEEYGVPFQTALTVVGRFLLGALVDDTISPEIIERIFIEIIELFPSKMDKKSLGIMLLRICDQAVEQKKSKSIIKIESNAPKEKIKKLLQATDIFGSKTQLWIPN